MNLLQGEGFPPAVRSRPGRRTAAQAAFKSDLAMAIGLFCLVALLLLRNLVQLGVVGPEFDSVQATVIQFRDFVSGCVGFLIGTPTHQSSQTP